MSDPTYSQQWHLNNTGQSSGNIDADIDAPEAWQIFKGSSSVKIGIFDTGVSLNHEDLSGKASGDNRSSAGSEPYQSHGTHVAGIATAKADNSYGGRGVDWNAKIESRQIFDGYGSYLGDQNASDKIIAAANAGIQIQNHSWGGTTFNTTIRLAFAHAYKMNRVATVAMGNSYESGNSTMYPAAYGQGITAVGATTDEDERSPYSQTGNHIDVVAPGGINSWTYRNGHDIWSTFGSNSYENMAGTSMATPVVAGIASLIKGYKSYLDNDDIEKLIRISTDDKGATGWDQEYGTGRVNAYKALQRLGSPYLTNQATATGGTIYSIDNIIRGQIYGATGLPDGIYWYIRYNVRKTVTFYPAYTADMYIWGRGSRTTGWASSPTYSMPWCDLVPGSIVGNSAILETYCYQIYEDGGVGSPYGGGFAPGDYIGWFPCSPSNAIFAFTTNGRISILKSNENLENENIFYYTELVGNYPNPFNPSTTIKYQIPEKTIVKLSVFDVLGREVAQLVNEEQDAGKYSVQFNATNYASGIYFYHIEAGNYVATKKMILMK
ncbi:MAG: S8 family peptidase [Ignavibacteriae bacterium]|nr:S8 family peptidase [Ignavibacteriota bacterium]